jgi:hypothetical protein
MRFRPPSVAVSSIVPAPSTSTSPFSRCAFLKVKRERWFWRRRGKREPGLPFLSPCGSTNDVQNFDNERGSLFAAACFLNRKQQVTGRAA